MKTPICDFAKAYAEKEPLRLHVPGHKGIGSETARFDITEVGGADSLYEASGIIRESEENASLLFGCPTYYTTEGSSHAIRAMLFLAGRHAAEQGKPLTVLAARNVHRSFVTAAALLDFRVTWLSPTDDDTYLSCKIDMTALEEALKRERPTALYLTSPDYLGNVASIETIAALCHRYGVLLLVDNAHGAYLKFLSPSRHPIDLGADFCCDSAHKTLPVLTGGAYLHLSERVSYLREEVKEALSLFGSTSPSYLILQSLDACNAYLDGGYRERLAAFAEQVEAMKADLRGHGYTFLGDEPLKVTLSLRPYGYDGKTFAALLEEQGVAPEFVDPDAVVLMLTPEIGREGLRWLTEVLCSIPKRPPRLDTPPRLRSTEAVMSIREATLAPKETVSVTESVGRIAASASLGCPPAVPIVVSGERITEAAVRCLAYYGITSCRVVKE